MPQLLKNNVSGVLSGGINAVATTMTLVDASNFPDPGADYYLVTLVGLNANGQEASWEIVRVTGKASNTLTIVRAQESTTAASWPSATPVQMRMTAGSTATKDDISTLTTSVSNKEPAITAGTTSQYWRGDKSWRDFFTDVRASTLTGLSTATNAVIAAADTVLGALGKLQAQISGLSTSKADVASPTFTGTPAAPTATSGTNTTQIATTAFVNAEIAADAAPLSHVGSTGTAHGNATTSVAGFMSATDKTKLDGVATGATANTGTVTSVALSLPAEFTVSGSPVTTSGTLTATKANQTANTFFSAPNGSAGAPTFRAIVAADVPTLNQNTTGTAANVTGTVAVANGGTGANTLTGLVKGNGTNAFTAAVAGTDFLAPSAIGTTVQGYDADLAAIAGLAGTSGLPRKTAADTWSLDTNTYLTANQSITLSGDASGTGSTAITVTLATVAASKGGTGQTTYAVGDILYASATNALSKLAGVATGSALISGGVGAAPSWGKVGLTTHVSGTLGVANGGTGATTLTGLVKGNGTGAFTAAVAGTDFLAPAAIGVSVQGYDADLAAIAALAGTSGLLRKTAADTWSLDTSTFLTGNQSITVSGDASGTGATAIALTLADSGVAAGTYNNSATAITPITVDAKGRVTGTGSAVTITPAWSSITSKPTTISGYGITDAYTKTEVDNLVTGLDMKQSVRVATTANITLSGTQTVDGVALVAGDRILVKNQTTGSQNGIYVVGAAAWSRSTDADASTEVTPGLYVFVEEGTNYADSGWVLTTNAPITVGTTALTFAQFNGLGQVTAGTGLGKNGNTISLTNTAVSPASYGSATQVATFTVDAQGRLTAAGSTTVTPAFSSVTDKPTTLSGYGITDALSNSTSSTQNGYFGDLFLWDDSTPSHYLQITNSANLTAARALSINVNDGDRTVSLSGNLTVSSAASVSGTNTGDQTITLTGDVTGSGTGSFAATLADSGVAAGTYAKVTVDAKGRVTTGASLASSDVTTALAFTPANKAGDTFTGRVKVDSSGSSTTFFIDGGTSSGFVTHLLSNTTTTFASDNGLTSSALFGNLSQPIISNSGAGGANNVTAWGGYFAPQIASSGASALIGAYGVQGFAERSNVADVSTNAGNVLYGGFFTARHTTQIANATSSATLAALTGSAIVQGGTVTNAYGVFASGNVGSSTTANNTVNVANYYQFFGNPVSVGSAANSYGTITNYYGLYLSAPTVAARGTITNRWGVYQADTLATNYFAGTLNAATLTASKAVFTDASKNLTSTGTLGIDQGGTGQTTKVAAFDALSPATTKGDLIVFNGTDNVRLAVGANDTVLVADSTQAAGVKWAAAGGGFSSVSTISGNTTAVKSTLYVLNASLTLTLPATPSTGDMVGVSNMSGTTTGVIARNGSLILGLAEDMAVDVLNYGFTLIYSGATKGWVIV